MSAIKSGIRVLAITIAVLASFMGCSQNPTSGLQSNDLENVEGFVIYRNGEEVAAYENSVLAGETSVKMSEENAFRVEFYDEAGNTIDLDADNHGILFAYQPEANFTIKLHKDRGEGIFCIYGNTEGPSTFSIKLVNGDPSAPVYETPDISVMVGQ